MKRKAFEAVAQPGRLHWPVKGLRGSALTLGLTALLAVAACGNKSESARAPAAEASAAAAASVRSDMSAKRVAAPAGGAQAEATRDASAPATPTTPESGRYIALRHSLTLETSSARVKPVFESWVQRCVLPQCELLVANFSRETEGNPPSASIEMRIQPKQADGFIASLTQDAEILAHNRGSEDRTDQVVDAEAQLKNLTQLRDQLRAMLSQRQGSLKDTLDVQRELANTQSRLDSLAGIRKALANETEKVAVSVSLQAKREALSAQVWSPLQEAWANVGSVTASSMAAIVTFVAAVLPWLVIGLPVLWLLRRFWKRRRKVA